jgi:hypothetical protein
MRRTAAFLAGFVALSATCADAALVTFSDRLTFTGATGATSATGPLPNAGAVGPGYTVGDLTFTTLSGQLFIGTLGIPPTTVSDWSATLPGNNIAISDVESFRVGLAAPVYSFGFDFFEPNVTGLTSPPTDDCFATCFDSTFTVNLYSGATLLGSFDYNAPDAVAAFVGVWTDFAFNRVDIIDKTATIDDEYWGEFYTGTEPVPEPGTVGLLGLGLLALHRRRRRR